MLVAAISVNAQSDKGKFSIAPKFGVATSVYAYEGDDTFNPNWKMGFQIGAEAEYGLSRKCALVGGLEYNMLGTKEKYKMNSFFTYWDVHSNVEGVTSHSLSLPLGFKYYLCGGLAVKAGVRLNYLLSTTTSGTVEPMRVVDKPGLGVYNNNGELELRYGDGSPAEWESFGPHDISDWVKVSMSRVSVDIPVGASYEYKNFVLGATCYLRVTDNDFTQTLVNNHDSEDIRNLVVSNYKVRHELFSVSLAYRFSVK